MRVRQITYQRLLNASKIVIRVVLAEGGPEDFTFLPKKTAEATRRIVSACPVSSGLDAAPIVYQPGEHLETPSEMKRLDEQSKAKEEKHNPSEAPAESNPKN
jgi:hypothetical protein